MHFATFCFARVCSHVDDFNNRNKFLTSKLLKQGYKYHKLRKAFSKFYYRHFQLIIKYNICLKTLLQQGVSEPVFYGDLVYKFKLVVLYLAVWICCACCTVTCSLVMLYSAVWTSLLCCILQTQYKLIILFLQIGYQLNMFILYYGQANYAGFCSLDKLVMLQSTDRIFLSWQWCNLQNGCQNCLCCILLSDLELVMLYSAE